MKTMVVSGVNMGAVKVRLVEEALAKRELPAGGSEAQKVARLATWYQTNTPKNRIADCGTCGGESDVEEPACPFCGDGEVEDVAPEPVVPAGVSGKAAAVVERAPEPAPALPARALNGQSLVKVEKGATRVTPAPAPVEYVQPAITEEALDAEVAAVRVLMASAADRLWELGWKLKNLFDTTLWTARKADDGVATRYRSWGQFCEAEFGISHGYSLKLMDVAREFTREQVKQIGASKLYITLQVPKGEARDRLLGMAPGASRKELQEAAAEEGKEKRETGRTGKGGAGTHKPGGKTGGRKPEKITVAMLTTRVELYPLDQKGRKSRIKVASPLACEERMFNGVKQRVVVTNDEAGHLMVVVERVRE